MHPHAWLLSLSVLTASALHAQPTSPSMRIAGRAHYLVPTGGASVPLLPGSRPTVLVSINGRGPFRMLVETGSAVSYVLGKVFSRAFPDGSRETDTLRIGDVALTGIRVSSISDLGLQDIDGLLGLDALTGASIAVDFPQRQLRVSADTLPAANERDVVGLRRASVFWAVPIAIGDQTVDAIIDTQSALSLSAAPARGSVLSFTTSPVTVGRARGPTIGDVPVQRARLNTSVRIGDAELQAPLVELLPLASSLPQEAFILGLQVLSEFAVTLDLRSGRARFARANRVVPAPKPVYLTGLNAIVQPDHTRRVSSVLPGSAAMEAGVAVGETVVRANGVPIAEVTDVAWRELTSGPAVLTLMLRRDGVEREVRITPRPAGF